jgi:prolyl-tRNA synthetase
VKGYIGPEALGEERQIPYLVDPRVVVGTSWITGANEQGRHVFDLVCGRDFTPDGTIEAAEVREGDPAPDGSGPLHLERGIEIGHIFQLGRKYAEALGLSVLDEHGKSRVVTMGSYGIGVSRAVAAIAEQHHDEKGLLWPREVAPADVHIVATGKDAAVFTAAEELALALEDEGLRVLYDDRKASPGVKFNDSELLGVPTIVVVGKRLVDGMIEIKDRASGERREVPLAGAVGALLEACGRSV